MGVNRLPDLSDRRIALDLDGTWADCHEAWDNLYERRRDSCIADGVPHGALPADGCHRDYRSHQKICPACASHAIASPEIAMQMRPFPHSVETVLALHAAGAWLCAITHRLPAQRAASRDWIAHVGARRAISGLWVTSDGKRRLAESLGVTDIIDDAPHVHEEFVDGTSSCRHVLMRRPYNESLAAVPGGRVVSDWGEIARLYLGDRVAANLIRRSGHSPA